MPKQQQKTGELTLRQARFVNEYLIDLNATQAAMRAGYSAKSAKQQGARLLTNATVSEAVIARRAKLEEATGITQERVLAELGKIGFSDIRKIFDADGRLKNIHELDDDTAAAIASIEVVTKALPGEADDQLDAQPHGGALARRRNSQVEYVHKIKTVDKRAALVDIGRHLGMFKDKGDDDKPQGDTYIDNRVQVIQQVNSDLERIFGESLRSAERPPREH